jgi:hypothetical protein
MARFLACWCGGAGGGGAGSPPLTVRLHGARHLLLAVHGVGTPTDASLAGKLAAMQREVRALAASLGACVPGVDTDYVLWAERSLRLGQVTAWLSRLHVPAHPVIRETARKSVLQAALYMGGFREDIQAAMLNEVNRKYALYLATHPCFADQPAALAALLRCDCLLARGGGGEAAAAPDAPPPPPICAAHVRRSHVSLFCHSLGGVIAVDVLVQRPYPLLFTPAHLFALGSPIGL